MPNLRLLVPVSFANLFRALVLLALAMHVFYMYCTARGMGEHFGFDLGTTVIGALFALAMLVPLVWAVFLPDVPEFITQHLRPRRRWRKGQCPHCGYDRMSLPREETTCPECGGQLREPTSFWQVNARTVRRFIAINLLAWVIGCAAGEMWMQMDERDFRREVEMRTLKMPDHGRARRWPNESQQMSYVQGHGYFAGRRPLIRRH